jgi:hypothetical protein
MNAVTGAVNKLNRTVVRAATMTTEAAGAVGGAAVSGALGAVTGATAGVQRGISSGSRSTPAAALTLGTLGVAGLIEWPVLLTVGGAAVLLRQLNRRPEPEPGQEAAPVTSMTSAKSAEKQQPRRTNRTRSPSPRRTRASQ